MNNHVNLITPERLAKIKKASMLNAISQGFIILLISLGISSALLYFANKITTDTNNAIISDATSNRSTTENITAINNYASTLSVRYDRPIPLSTVLDTVASIIPKDAHLTSLSLSAKDELHIIGFSASRNSVVLIKDALTTSPLFTKVNAPLDNILKPENITFDFSAQVQRKPPAPASP